MDETLLSIVVPIYNVRDYLEQCIESILNQTYRNIEVILVNDGSTDGSHELCEKYAALDKRIKFISQVNQGVVRARKNGVSIATGAHIAFVDADDYVEPDLYQQIMECSGNFDLVNTGWFIEKGGKTRATGDWIAPGAYQTPEDMDFLLHNLVGVTEPGGVSSIQSGIHISMWNKLFKTSLVREVFESVNESLTIGEDQEFVFRYVFKCKSIFFADICGYHYRARSGSATHSPAFGMSVFEQYLQSYGAAFSVLESHPRRDILVPQMQFRFSTRLARLTAKMGFPPERRVQPLIFPFINLLDNKRVALCGAGMVGQTYWRQIQRHKFCDLQIWVDRDWAYYQRLKRPVFPNESLLDNEFDCVIIGAFHEETAQRMKADLISLGIEESKILWKAPIVQVI